MSRIDRLACEGVILIKLMPGKDLPTLGGTIPQAEDPRCVRSEMLKQACMDSALALYS